MKYRLEHQLDECLARLTGGEELEYVLAGFPEHADELRPLLAATEWMRDLVPPPTGKRERKAELLETVAARRRLVEAAEGVVVEIKAGVPENELFERCPHALHPVILAARTLRDAEPPWPATDRRAADKRRLMNMVEKRRKESLTAHRVVSSLRFGLGIGLAPRSTFMRRARAAAVTLSLAAAVALAGTAGVAPVAASSLPGEPLYHVKRFGENAELLVTFDPERRVTLRALHAQRRLDEMARLREVGGEIPESLFESWLNGQAGIPNALAGLSTDQRRMLADIADRLSGRADAESDAVIAELRALRAAEASAAAEAAAARLAEQEAAEDAINPAGFDWATRPILRPLPDEPKPRVDPPKDPIGAVQPPIVPIVDRPADDVPGAIQATIPNEDDDQNSGSGSEQPPAGAGEPGAGSAGGGGSEPPSGIAPPSSGEAPSEPPPPFVQPAPPSEPTPDEPPGGIAP